MKTLKDRKIAVAMAVAQAKVNYIRAEQIADSALRSARMAAILAAGEKPKGAVEEAEAFHLQEMARYQAFLAQQKKSR